MMTKDDKQEQREDWTEESLRKAIEELGARLEDLLVSYRRFDEPSGKSKRMFQGDLARGACHGLLEAASVQDLGGCPLCQN